MYTNRCFHHAAALPPRPAIARTIHADAVYGAFALLKGYYIALITKAAAVATAPHGASILQVQDMEWVLVGNGYATSVKESEKGAVGTTLTAAQQHEEDTHLALLKRIAETRSFYYSHDYDMTNSVQRNDSIDSGALTPQISPSTPRPKWVHSDERFWWNKSALREVLAAAATDSVASSSAASHPYAVPVINGFVGHRPIPEFASDLLLISRRACGRQGTRFNMRGADHEGNVANYAETEQIVVQGTGAVSSYVQVRGSIPLLWEQPVTLKYTPRCALYDSKTINQSVFNKHMAALLDRYSRVTAVNLIDKKGDQKVLGQAYSDASASFPHPASYRYVWWDFHGETKSSKGGWKSLGKLLQEVQAEVAKDGVYSKDADGNVLSIQKGTVRTNCMDNLDRTNVVQSLFARHAAVTVLPGAADRVRAAGGNIMSTPYPEFERAFNNLWADNADAMSVLYSGTGALKTDFTRTGKRTLAGALQDGVNSVHRYILNNLDDGRTQDAWDLFLGRYVPVRVGMAASKGGSYSPAMAAHLAGPTPVRTRHRRHHSPMHGFPACCVSPSPPPLPLCMCRVESLLVWPPSSASSLWL